MQAKTHLYLHIYLYRRIYAQISMPIDAINGIYIYIYTFILYMHLDTQIYGCIWPFIPIYAVFRHPRGTGDTFTMHSHPGSWCVLYQADTAMVQCHPTTIWRAVAPAKLPYHVVTQCKKNIYTSD